MGKLSGFPARAKKALRLFGLQGRDGDYVLEVMMSGSKLACVLGLVVGAFAVVQLAFAGPVVNVGGQCNVASRPSLEEVDHAVFDRLLGTYVDSRGMVDYAAWTASRADRRALEQYLRQLGCVSLGKAASRQAKLAYWINVYNALTIHGILREYPTRSIRNHTARLWGYNIWKELLLWVDGKRYSLEQIEHEVLRKLGEPRIHFAIVCASIGCPKLKNEAYTARGLESQLAAAARDFFADAAKFRVDAAAKTLYVSPILKWFATDFGTTQAQQLRTISPYLPSATARRVAADRSVSVSYLGYDWSINEQ